MLPNETSPTKATPADWIARALAFAVLAVIAFSRPGYPAPDLDPSWRMALGKFFQDGLQFGTDVVFTYGPLGFVMGKTYSGLQFASLIAWQMFLAVTFTSILFWHAYRLKGYARLLFFIFLYLLGVTYEDALHQMIIMLAGMEMIRRSGSGPGRVSFFLTLLLALLALIKFTNLLLGGVLVLIAAGFDYWKRRQSKSALQPAIFGGAFLVGWMLCGQNPLNLPAYFIGSWQVSQGYQDAMGISPSSTHLIFGLVSLGLVIVYAAVYLLSEPDRARAFALVSGLGVFIYLNWKHGFVRADGHMIGFHYSVMTVALLYPVLMVDGESRRWLRRLLLTIAGMLSLFSVESVLPGLLRGALGSTQERFFSNVRGVFNPADFRGDYEHRLNLEKIAYELPETREVVGAASIDVTGFEQGVALFNQFNYRPRPVFQSYSAYTPYLAKLNADHYASERAPEFVLHKLQTIDRRMLTLDDALLLPILLHRYTYIHTEKGFQLWKRKDGTFDRTAVDPILLRTATLNVGEDLPIEESRGLIWATVDLRSSLLGRLRRFFYKPPVVMLRVTDQSGREDQFRLPLPMARTGFILNPLIEDAIGFMHAAGGTPERFVRSIALDIAPQDRDCFAATATITLSELPSSLAGEEFFSKAKRAQFHMFKALPVSFEAKTPLSEGVVDGRTSMVLHAPSEMVFDIPLQAREVTGWFGFMPGAYTEGGRTNGAEFVVYWSAGGEPQVLFRRTLDPLNRMGDRGLQAFTANVPANHGRIYLRINPGPFNEFAYDWTVWSDVEFK